MPPPSLPPNAPGLRPPGPVRKPPAPPLSTRRKIIIGLVVVIGCAASLAYQVREFRTEWKKAMGETAEASSGSHEYDSSALTREERLTSILVLQLSVPEEKILPDARLVEDLGADELDKAEIVMTLEEAFALEGIPDEEAERFLTVKNISDYLDRVVPRGDEFPTSAGESMATEEQTSEPLES